MSAILGKRKRQVRRARKDAPDDTENDGDRLALQAAFQKAFEVRFKPLDVVVKPVIESAQPDIGTDEPESAEDTDGFEGFSSEEEAEDCGQSDETPTVEVIDYASTQQLDLLSPADAKAFMSSKPPVVGGADTVMRNKSTIAAETGEEDKSEKLNLKNDLALQRLINESHLLEKAKNGTLSGQRQKITEMRLQSLGSKGSILAQEKMPMSHRKGIVAKAKEKESTRRAEAKENGIILERTTKVKKAEERRTRGVGGPSVGSFKGGTLKLSKGDVSNIRSTKVTREGRRRK